MDVLWQRLKHPDTGCAASTHSVWLFWSHVGTQGSSILQWLEKNEKMDSKTAQDTAQALITGKYLFPNDAAFSASTIYQLRKNLVIVGGGHAGYKLLQETQEIEFLQVTLIEPNSHFHSKPALVAKNVAPDSIPPVSYTLGKVKHIVSKAVAFTATQVTCANQTIVDYDYLVLATGSHYATMPQQVNDASKKPCTVIYACEHEQVSKHHDALVQANHITVVGSGSTAIEYLFEMAYAFPKKQIVLATSSDKYLSQYPEACHTAVEVEAKLYSNVTLMNKARVAQIVDNQVIMADGKQITTDVVLVCTGFKPSTSMLASFVPLDSDTGLVKVNEHLQVEGFKNVFAIGDINNVKENKSAIMCKNHTPIVLNNIRALETRTSLQKYVSDTPMAVISFGPSMAVFVRNQTVLHWAMWGYLKRYALTSKIAQGTS